VVWHVIAPASEEAHVRRVTALFTYPVKSCRGVAHEAAEVGRRGLVGDREFMVVNEVGRFLTQREHPRLALVVPSLDGERLRVSGEGFPTLELDIRRDGARRPVTVWRDACAAIDQGDEVAEWFTQVIGAPCRLVRMPDGELRRADQEHAGPGDEVGFADGYPLLLTTLSSLAALNERMPVALPMDRFRPNVVVDGVKAFEEDGWGVVEVGEVRFRVVKPCARCAITTVDQGTGAVGKEPLRTLATFRHVPGRGVMFGQNLVHEGRGTVGVGMAVGVRG